MLTVEEIRKKFAARIEKITVVLGANEFSCDEEYSQAFCHREALTDFQGWMDERVAEDKVRRETAAD